MATKSSGKLGMGASYTLGKYVFSMSVEPVSGSYSMKYTAKCRYDGKTASKSIIIQGSATSWYVEANDTVATVYIAFEGKPPVGVPLPVPYATGGGSAVSNIGGDEHYSAPIVCIGNASPSSWQPMSASSSPGNATYSDHMIDEGRTDTFSVPMSSTYTFNGKTVYYTLAKPGDIGRDGHSATYSFSPAPISGSPNWGPLAWYLVYGDDKAEEMVGRFTIELEDAGGTGEDSDWDDPGDEDEDRDPDDPTTTLYLTVTGALSGRHNDPLHDTSYSYKPKDNETQKPCGYGGNGGYGGGGGAGAASVVVFKFATSRADSKDILTKARRHGYGSGGGKGGKGGPGCILIYY